LLEKIELLAKFNLHFYCFEQVRNILEDTLLHGRINKHTILFYVYCKRNYGKLPLQEYEKYIRDLFTYSVDQTFITFDLNRSILQDYENIRNDKAIQKDRAVFDEVNALQPVF
jgi:hypothetical protein